MNQQRPLGWPSAQVASEFTDTFRRQMQARQASAFGRREAEAGCQFTATFRRQIRERQAGAPAALLA